jgi:hypothetical protein
MKNKAHFLNFTPLLFYDGGGGSDGKEMYGCKIYGKELRKYLMRNVRERGKLKKS